MTVGQNDVHPCFSIPFATFITPAAISSEGVEKSTPKPPRK